MRSRKGAAWRHSLLYLLITLLSNSLLGIVGAVPIDKRDASDELEAAKDDIANLFAEFTALNVPKGTPELSKEDKRRLYNFIDGIQTAAANGDIDESLYVMGDSTDPTSDTYKAAHTLSKQISGDTYTNLRGEKPPSKKIKTRATSPGTFEDSMWNPGYNAPQGLVDGLRAQWEQEAKIPEAERIGIAMSPGLNNYVHTVVKQRWYDKIIVLTSGTAEERVPMQQYFAVYGEAERTQHAFFNAKLKTRFPRIFGKPAENELAETREAYANALKVWKDHSAHIAGSGADIKRRLMNMKATIKGKAKQIFRTNDVASVHSPDGKQYAPPKDYNYRQPPKGPDSSKQGPSDLSWFRFDGDPELAVGPNGKKVFYKKDAQGKRTVTSQKVPGPVKPSKGVDVENIVPVDTERGYNMVKKAFMSANGRSGSVKWTPSKNTQPPNPDDVGDSTLSESGVGTMVKQSETRTQPKLVKPQRHQSITAEHLGPGEPTGGEPPPGGKEPTGGVDPGHQDPSHLKPRPPKNPKTPTHGIPRKPVPGKPPVRQPLPQINAEKPPGRR